LPGDAGPTICCPPGTELVGAGDEETVPPGAVGAIILLSLVGEVEGGVLPEDIPGAVCPGTCAELSPAGAEAVVCANANPAEHKTAIAAIGINRIKKSSIRRTGYVAAPQLLQISDKEFTPPPG